MQIISNDTVSLIAATPAILLDWTKVDTYGSLEFVVENAGEVTASIDSISLSFSNDGGTTFTQPAAVDDFPALPIAAHGAGIYPFESDYDYVKITAVSTAGGITANGILLGETIASRIVTLNDVKSRLGITTTDSDTMLERIIAGVEAIFNRHTMRTLIAPAADVTEYYTGCSSYLQLNNYPVISITSIKEALDYDFDSATALVANSEYRLVKVGKNGILYKLFNIGWYGVPDSIEVKYRGGYCAAGITPGTGELALPDDLREAAILQSTFVFKRKDDIGLSGVSEQGGSMSKFADMELLPMVKEILDNYKRPTL